MLFKFHSIVNLLFIGILISCSEINDELLYNDIYADRSKLTIHELNPEPVYEISFELVAEIEVLDNNDRIAVDEHDRIFLGGNTTVRVYEPDGTPVSALGRDGDGPGEFRTGYTQPKIVSGFLVVYDEVLNRINFFSLDTLEYEYSIQMEPDRWDHIDELEGFAPYSINYFISGDDSFLLEFRENSGDLLSRADRSGSGGRLQDTENVYYRMDLDGTIYEEPVFTRPWTRVVSVQPDGRSSYLFDPPFPSVPFIRNSLMAVNDKGHIFHAWSEDFLVREYDPNGKYLSAFLHSFDNSEFILGEVPAGRASVINNRNIGLITVPETWPALQGILTDDEGRLWISTITDESYHYEWWVTDESGHLLARFQWPALRWWPDTRSGIKLIKNGFLYHYISHEGDYDNEEHIPLWQKYRIMLEERTINE